MKIEQLAYFQYQSIASQMLVKATEFETTRDGRLTTLYTVTIINNDKAVTLRPGTRVEAIRQAEAAIQPMVALLNEVYSPDCEALVTNQALERVFLIEYKHLKDGSLHKITADNLKDAQDLWDTFKLRHNHYLMVCPRPT
jgi:hypothetical protein